MRLQNIVITGKGRNTLVLLRFNILYDMTREHYATTSKTLAQLRVPCAPDEQANKPPALDMKLVGKRFPPVNLFKGNIRYRNKSSNRFVKELILCRYIKVYSIDKIFLGFT